MNCLKCIIYEDCYKQLNYFFNQADKIIRYVTLYRITALQFIRKGLATDLPDSVNVPDFPPSRKKRYT